MFIFYKMEYVIAYKMLFKESIDEKKMNLFLGMSLALCWSMPFNIIIFNLHVSLFGFNDTASLCLKCFL